MSELDAWPGADHRRPPRGWPSSAAIRAPLAAWLHEEARAAERAFGRYRVLDVGCGVKPYYPFFAASATDFVGVDVVPNPAADLQGSVESLPVADGTFDVVLCTQVLEHAADPGRAVRELFRVTAPGGRVLASTHGVQVYHPSPDDFWRWTHTGLERLFTENASWASVSVRPASGTTACLGMLVSTYVYVAAERARAPALGRAVCAAVNAASVAIDRRFPRLTEPGPGTMFANFHVRAEKER